MPCGGTSSQQSVCDIPGTSRNHWWIWEIIENPVLSTGMSLENPELD